MAAQKCWQRGRASYELACTVRRRWAGGPQPRCRQHACCLPCLSQPSAVGLLAAACPGGQGTCLGRPARWRVTRAACGGARLAGHMRHRCRWGGAARARVSPWAVLASPPCCSLPRGSGHMSGQAGALVRDACGMRRGAAGGAGRAVLLGRRAGGMLHRPCRWACRSAIHYWHACICLGSKSGQGAACSWGTEGPTDPRRRQPGPPQRCGPLVMQPSSDLLQHWCHGPALCCLMCVDALA